MGVTIENAPGGGGGGGPPPAGSVVNASVAATAAIAASKLAFPAGPGLAHVDAAGVLSTGLLVNADVAGGAAIASSKIAFAAFAFGATTDYVSFNAPTVASGNLRIPSGAATQTIVATHIGAADVPILALTNAGGGTIIAGDSTRQWYTQAAGYEVRAVTGSAGFVVATNGGATTQATLQNSTANDFLAFGSTPATSGTIRLSSGQGTKVAQSGVDYDVIKTSASTITVSNTSFTTAVNGYTVQLNTPAGGSVTSYTDGHVFATPAGAEVARVISTSVGAAAIRFAAGTTLPSATGVTAPTITQAPTAVANATAPPLAILAANATGASSTGGDLQIGGGTGTGAVGRVDFRNATPVAGRTAGTTWLPIKVGGTPYYVKLDT